MRPRFPIGGPASARWDAEARRRVIEKPRRRMVAGLGDELAVAAEHRRGDDAGEHGQRRIGRCEDRFDHPGGRIGRNELARARELAPVDELSQHRSHAVLGERLHHGQPVVVAHGPGRASARAKQPGRVIRGEQGVPGLAGRVREIAVVGAQHRPACCGLSKTDRPVRATICVDRSDFVIVLRRPFRGLLHHRLHGVGATAQQQIVEILSFLWRHRDPDPSAFGCEPVRSGFGSALACAGAVMISEDYDARAFDRVLLAGCNFRRQQLVGPDRATTGLSACSATPGGKVHDRRIRPRRAWR